jgi:hypothetical protein
MPGRLSRRCVLGGRRGGPGGGGVAPPVEASRSGLQHSAGALPAVAGGRDAEEAAAEGMHLNGRGRGQPVRRAGAASHGSRRPDAELAGGRSPPRRCRQRCPQQRDVVRRSGRHAARQRRRTGWRAAPRDSRRLARAAPPPQTWTLHARPVRGRGVADAAWRGGGRDGAASGAWRRLARGEGKDGAGGRAGASYTPSRFFTASSASRVSSNSMKAAGGGGSVVEGLQMDSPSRRGSGGALRSSHAHKRGWHAHCKPPCTAHSPKPGGFLATQTLRRRPKRANCGRGRAQRVEGGAHAPVCARARAWAANSQRRAHTRHQPDPRAHARSDPGAAAPRRCAATSVGGGGGGSDLIARGRRSGAAAARPHGFRGPLSSRD